MRTSKALLTILAVGGLLLGGLTQTVRAEDKEEKAEKPKVEVVFCLDTTGSMGSLIAAAKQKIWAMSNQILSGTPTPDLKIGLVAYRDRKDAYVTKVFDLTDDLDAIHGHLKTFQAQGGGDTPESVNQALHEAVTKIKWSKDEKTLKIIFLVGDAPPHTDYKDDVQYPETCKLAVKNNIIINTIQCGGMSTTRDVWQEICKKSEGEYVQIDQRGATVIVATPYDKELRELNGKLTDSVIVFGGEEKRRRDLRKADDAKKLAAPAAAERAAASAKGGKAASFDLLEAVKRKEVRLDELKDSDLPEKIRKMKPEERKQYLKKVSKDREVINKQILELDKKRSEHIKKELAKNKLNTKNAFDGKVLEMLRKQAKKHNIKY